MLLSELSEKHNSLIRLLDKESRSNRLLSQQNEQLEWRLSHAGVPPSPDIMRRSLELPPPSPGAFSQRPPGSTPDVMRRSLQFPPGSAGFDTGSHPAGLESGSVPGKSRGVVRTGSTKARCWSEAGPSKTGSSEVESGSQGESQAGSAKKAGLKSGSSTMDAMRLSLAGFALPTRSAPVTPRAEKWHGSVLGGPEGKTGGAGGAIRPTSLLLDDLDQDLEDEDSLEFLNSASEEDN